jgi:hypothetical protein
MSERNVHLPGFPAVKVCVWGTSPLREASQVVLRYVGTAADLIASGVATAEMLSRFKARERERRDPSGHRYFRNTTIRRNGLQLVPCYRVIMFKPRAVAIQMPGGAAAIEAEQSRQDADVFGYSVRPAPPQAPRPSRHLRLAVNNLA